MAKKKTPAQLDAELGIKPPRPKKPSVKDIPLERPTVKDPVQQQEALKARQVAFTLAAHAYTPKEHAITATAYKRAWKLLEEAGMNNYARQAARAVHNHRTAAGLPLDRDLPGVPDRYY